VSSRTYLSIGDVLALLRQEFPDVTISKIRFLESQGLVNPERTPSGYRKFYEHDVERLRWVLRQQREHFLPLKVIKGRLDDEGAEFGDGDEPFAPGPPEPVLVGRASGSVGPRAAGRELPGFEPQAVETTRRSADGGRSTPAVGTAGADMTQRRAAAAAASAASVAAAAARVAPASPAPSAPSARPSARPSSGAARPQAAGPARARPGGGASSAPAGSPPPGPGAGRGKEPVRTAGAKATAAPTTAEAAVSDDTVSDDTVSDATGSDATGSDATAHHGERRARFDGELVEEVVGGTLSGATMTVGELAEGSGLDLAAVEELESYGLVCGRVVGGVAYYDEDALVVARMAAGLARYGVEARHLRLHKHAAEREAGFIEQIVLPLLKQRNPEARQRAHEVVTELTLLGQGLREVLLRTTLRNQLGG
jgi:DNA-binding transcriptional MerR regulator